MPKSKNTAQSYPGAEESSREDSASTVTSDDIREALQQIAQRLDLSIDPQADLDVLCDATFYLDIFRRIFDDSLCDKIDNDRRFRKAGNGEKVQYLIDTISSEVVGAELPQVQGEGIAAGSLKDIFNLLQLILVLLCGEEAAEQAEDNSFERLEEEILRTSESRPVTSARGGSRRPPSRTQESQQAISVQATHERTTQLAPTGRRECRDQPSSSELSLSEIGAAAASLPSAAPRRSTAASSSHRCDMISQRSTVSRASTRTSNAYLRKTQGALSSLLQRQRLELNAVMRNKLPLPADADPEIDRITLQATRKTLRRLEEIERVEEVRRRDTVASQLRAL